MWRGVLLAALLVVSGCGGTERPDPTEAVALAPPPPPGLDIKPPMKLESATTGRYAPVVERVRVRAKPGVGAKVVATLEVTTPEDTTNIVGVLRTRELPGGEVWVRIRLPVLPNNTTGWVPRSALGGYGFVETHLVINLAESRATLKRGGSRIWSAPIGTGLPESPTPRGHFYIRNKLTRYKSAFYGPLAFGTSARSDTLTDWPAGGFVGIHGTDQPNLIPGRVSHGCIRLRNPDILELERLMPIGTPVTII